MDPNQPLRLIPIEKAMSILDEWLGRKHSFYWNKSPEWLVVELFNRSYDGHISVYNAHMLIQEVKTIKMPATANKGLDYILEEWKKISFKPTDSSPSPDQTSNV